MKKSKKVVISAGGKKALIDATNKQSISIVPMHENSSFLELEKELQEMIRLRESVRSIIQQMQHYSESNREH